MAIFNHIPFSGAMYLSWRVYFLLFLSSLSLLRKFLILTDYQLGYDQSNSSNSIYLFIDNVGLMNQAPTINQVPTI